jgi:hypothetical protein
MVAAFSRYDRFINIGLKLVCNINQYKSVLPNQLIAAPQTTLLDAVHLQSAFAFGLVVLESARIDHALCLQYPVARKYSLLELSYISVVIPVEGALAFELAVAPHAFVYGAAVVFECAEALSNGRYSDGDGFDGGYCSCLILFVFCLLLKLCSVGGLIVHILFAVPVSFVFDGKRL